nr:hypothetical protein TetV2_00460 [Oceanusvirus sp.]
MVEDKDVLSLAAQELASAFHSWEATVVKDAIMSSGMLKEELAILSKRQESKDSNRELLMKDVDECIEIYRSGQKSTDAAKRLRDSLNRWIAEVDETEPVSLPDEGARVDQDEENQQGGNEKEPKWFSFY